MERLKNFWNNLTPETRTIISIIFIVLIVVLIKKYGWKIKAFFTKRDINAERSDYLALDDIRKSELEQLASRAKERLDTWFSLWYFVVDDDSVLYEIDSLTDVELLYFSEYYNKVIGRNLRNDINALAMPYSSVDDSIYDKLVRLGI